MSSNDPPPAPDYTPIMNAQLAAGAESAQVAREQLAWAKEQYATNKGVTDKVVDSFLSTQAVNAKNAAADRARYETIFQPLEQDLANDAKSYASPERKALEMGRAEAGVAQQFGAARVSAQRDLEAYGVDPGDTRFAALDIGVRAQQAAAQAAAGNQASQMVDATGRALRSEAINVGRGYPGQIAGTYNTALQAGSGANGQNLATTASGANTMGTAPQWNAAAGNAYSGAANTMNTQYANNAAAYKQSQDNGWGQMLGAGLGMATMFLADGGAVGGPDGGPVPEQVSPSRGSAVDDVPARLNVGEFIMPEETVRFKGTEFFHKLITKSREAEAEIKAESGAIPSIHPKAMGAPAGAGRRQALQVS